jgi:membrane protein implicated in regulation of membrane protease activity
MAEHPIDARRRTEWERIRAGGLGRFLLVRGLVLRGLPMALAVVLLLRLFEAAPEGEAWRDPAFLVRFGVAVLLFSIGGVLSAYARWRALERRFERRATSPTGG